MRAEFASEPADLRAGIGPSIRGCCYEVSGEVAEAVLAATPAGAEPAGDQVVRPGRRGRPQVDLAAANRAQLLAAGLRPEHVELSEHCTSCRVDRFFSHRAERGQAGRQAAIVGQL